MSETCHPGIAYILQLYTEEQSRVDTALTHNVCHTSKEDGMRGMELPYQLRSDWMVTSVLFLCFILVSYVLAHGKKHLEQQFKNFALSKERASLFDDTTASDVRYTLVLILQTCILSGFCVYDYFSDHDLLLFRTVPHCLLLSIYIGYVCPGRSVDAVWAETQPIRTYQLVVDAVHIALHRVPDGVSVQVAVVTAGDAVGLQGGHDLRGTGAGVDRRVMQEHQLLQPRFRSIQAHF